MFKKSKKDGKCQLTFLGECSIETAIEKVLKVASRRKRFEAFEINFNACEFTLYPAVIGLAKSLPQVDTIQALVGEYNRVHREWKQELAKKAKRDRPFFDAPKEILTSACIIG